MYNTNGREFGGTPNIWYFGYFLTIEHFWANNWQGIYNSHRAIKLWFNEEKLFHLIFTTYQNYPLAIVFTFKNLGCMSLPVISVVDKMYMYTRSPEILPLKSTIKCFKEVKIDKWPDLSYEFLPIVSLTVYSVVIFSQRYLDNNRMNFKTFVFLAV